jgi:ATP-dependent DNA helicase RecG
VMEDLLALPEGKTLEFKRDLSSPKNLLKTLVAFANTAGGRAIIGVDDQAKQPMGVEFPLDDEERLCSLIADSISPRLVPNIEMVTVQNRTLLIVEVYLSNSRPHYLRSEGSNNGVYVRLGSSNRQADRELIGELRRSSQGVSFDAMPMPDLAESDLDLDVAQKCFGDRRQLDQQGLLTLRLLCPDQGKLVPTKGAMILFGKNREFHWPDAWVQCGRFVGQDKAAIFDHIELYDALPQMVDSIMLFLKKHAMRGADFSEIRRRDVWSIPLGILREVVINALVHSDYSQRGAPIRVAFFDDRIEVENPGILLPGMTIEDMKQGISKIRNPVIARVFRELELIEQWGSGVRRIFHEAEVLGLPVPLIVELGMRVRVTVFLAEHVVVSRTKAQVDAVGLESGLELGLESETSKGVLLSLVKQPLQRAEVARALGHEGVSGAVNRSIKELLSKQLIEYTIPEKPNSRLQKYRLTARGQALIAQGGSGDE